MKRKMILGLILLVMAFLLSGCIFWGGYGCCGYPVGFGVVYSYHPCGPRHHPHPHPGHHRW